MASNYLLFFLESYTHPSIYVRNGHLSYYSSIQRMYETIMLSPVLRIVTNKRIG